MGRVKKIIFTVTNDLSYDQRMQKICRSLSTAGYQVELVGRLRDFSIPISQEPYEQTRLKCLFNKGKLFYIEYNLRLLFYLYFSKFDGACAIDLDTIVPVYIAGRLNGAKLAYDAHEYFTEVPEVVRRPFVKKVWEWIEETYVPRFDLVYTVSGGLAELFEKKYKKHFEVIMNVPTATSPSVSKARPDDQVGRGEEQDKYILYQGALNEGRGLENLIMAMKDVSFKLKLAGEGDLSQSLRALVRNEYLENRVEFLGYVEPKKLKEVTAGASIGINLLENTGLSYYYSLSNKFFDYIHAGIPQVCIGFPEYKMINDKYEVALLTKDCETNEIKAAIMRLLTDKNLYAELQKKCEVCSRVLNWQAEEKKLLGLYGQLLG